MSTQPSSPRSFILFLDCRAIVKANEAAAVSHFKSSLSKSATSDELILQCVCTSTLTGPIDLTVAVQHTTDAAGYLSPIFCPNDAIAAVIVDGLAVYSVNTTRDDGGKDGKVR